MTSHPDVIRRGCGICGKLSRRRRATFQQIPQPRRRLDEIKKSVLQTSGARGTRSGKLYLLDTGLLMGGTHAIWCSLIDGSDRTRFVFCRFIRYRV